MYSSAFRREAMPLADSIFVNAPAFLEYSVDLSSVEELRGATLHSKAFFRRLGLHKNAAKVGLANLERPLCRKERPREKTRRVFFRECF